MSNISRNIKRVFCIVLLVIFSPFILLYLLIRGITKSMRKKTWKKKGLSGKQIVVSSTIDDVEKMEDFELLDYFKFLFFFDGYNTKLLSNKNKSAQYLLTRGGEQYLLRFSIGKKHNDQKTINELILEKQSRKIEKAIFITNRDVDKSIKNHYFGKMVKILDRSELKKFSERIVEKVKVSTVDNHIEGKNISEMLDIMYPNRI